MAPLPDGPTGTAREALEDVVRRFLERTPCLVSFSGGRDSSAVLAVATHVARRDGLALPIPFTFRFPGKPLTEESDWQEHVIRHLGLDDWPRVDLRDELDLLGDVARRCLLEFGLLWPANVYLHVPVFRAAAGGTVLTGLDGDGLFGDWRWAHAQAVLHRRVRAAAARRGPGGVRSRPGALPPGGLSPPGRLRPGLALAGGGGRVRRHRARPCRLRTAPVGSAGRLACRGPCPVSGPTQPRGDRRARRRAGGQPVATPRVSCRLGRRGRFGRLRRPDPGDAPPGGRPLPTETVERASKAAFGDAVWLEQARAFVDSWDGAGSTRRSSTPSGYGPPGGPSIPCSTAGRCCMRPGWRSQGGAQEK